MSTKFENFDKRVTKHLSRQTEGLAISEFVQENIGQSVVVYGKIDVGKSSVIRDEVISGLKERLPDELVHYGCYVIGTDQDIELTNAHKPPWETIDAGGIFFIDEFDNILSDTYQKQLLLLQRFSHALEVSNTPITFVLIINEDRLAELHSILDQVPNWNHKMLPIHGIDIAQTLVNATSKAANRDIEFEVGLVDRIAKEAVDELPSKRLGISPRFVSILAFQIARTLGNTGGSTFSNADYERLGKLNGLLRGFLSSQLSHAAEIDSTSRETLYAHVRELGEAGPVKGLDSFEDLQSRYDLKPAESESALDILENIVGVVRKRSDGRWRLVPSLLHGVVNDATRQERREIVHLEEDLRDGMNNWKRYGIPLPKELLFQIIARRTELPLDSEEIEFILDWVLREKSLDLDEARYWLRRIKDSEVRADVLRGALVDSDPDSRSRTAQLLSEHDCGIDVAEYLYDLALRDPVRGVREVAVDCLRKTDLARVRVQMLNSARLHSSYQQEAIRALGALSDKDSIELLTSIGKGDEINEPIDNRKIAVETLGKVNNDMARNALLSIGMQDPDQNVRAVAADRLSKQVNKKTAPDLLTRLMSWKSLQYSDVDRAITTSVVIRNTILAVLAMLGNLVPGILLIAIGRPKTGAVFIVGFVIAATSVFFGSNSTIEWFWSFWFLSCVATLFYSTRILLSDPKNAILSAGDYKWILRLIVFIALAVVAVLMDIVFVWEELYSVGFYIFALHGFAHILAKQYKTGLLIFFIQLLSFGYLLISQFQDGIIYYDDKSLFNHHSIWWNDHISAILFFVWMFVFFVTLAWDIVGVFLGQVILSRRSAVESRRCDLIRSFLCQRPFISYCLRALTSEDPTIVKRAHKSLRRYGALIDSPTLILKAADKIERYPKKKVIELLSCMQSNQALAEMERLLKDGGATTRELVVAALSKRPTSQSLDILHRHKNELTKAQQRRNKRRFFYNKLGALVHQLGTTSWLVIILLPLVTFFLFEQSRNYQNPHRQIEKLIMRNCDEQLQNRISIIEYMPHSATESNRKKNVRRQLETVYYHNCKDSIESDELSIKVSIIGALAKIAPDTSDNASTWQGLPDDAVSVLLDGLSEGESIDVHIRTIQVIRTLSVQYDFLKQEMLPPEVLKTLVERLSHALTTKHLDLSDREWVIDFFEGIAVSNELQDHVSDHLKEYVLKPLEYSPLDRSQQAEQTIQSSGDATIELRKYAVDALANIGSRSSLDALQELAERKSLHVEVRQFASEKLARKGLEPGLNPSELDESNWEATIKSGEEMATGFLNQNQEIPAELHRKLGAAYYLAEMSLSTGEYIGKSIYNLERYYELMNESSDVADGRALLNLAYSYIQKSWRILNYPETDEDYRMAFEVAAKSTAEPFLSTLKALRDIEVNSDPSYAIWEVDFVIMYAYCLQAAAKLASIDPLAIEDAEGLIVKALEYSDDFSYPYYLMGYKHWKKRDVTDAIDFLDKALWIDDNDFLAISLLDTISREADYTEAVVQKLEAHTETSSVLLISTLAFIYHVRLAPTRQSPLEAMSDFKTAKNFTEKAIELFGSSEEPSLQGNYVEALLTTGEYESVIVEGRKLLDTNFLDPEIRVMTNYYVLSAQYLKSVNQTDTQIIKTLLENIRLQFSSLKEAQTELPVNGDSTWNTSGTKYYLEHCATWDECSARKETTDALLNLLVGIETRSQKEFDAALSVLKSNLGFGFQPGDTTNKNSPPN